MSKLHHVSIIENQSKLHHHIESYISLHDLIAKHYVMDYPVIHSNPITITATLANRLQMSENVISGLVSKSYST